jgi:hypothetical protein
VTDSYSPALTKLHSRWISWLGLQLPLFASIKVWNIIFSPLTAYIDQLFIQPVWVSSMLDTALLKFVGGVNGWTSAQQLYRFNEIHHFPIQARAPRSTNTAALIRSWFSFTNLQHREWGDLIGWIADS